MMKNLLASAVMIAATLSASASTIKVWEGKTELKGWSDNVTVAASGFTAASAGCQLVVNITVDMTLDTTISYTNLGVKTNTDGWPALDGTGFQNPTGENATWEINATAAEQLKSTGLIIQGQNVVVTSVDLVTAEDIDPNLLFEGSYTASGWNKGADINPARLKAGDALRYTFTEAGSETGQILVKNSSWANLLGTSKITPKDMATGSVTVGVTDDMLADANGAIFLQGDGGGIVSKVELIPAAFDPKNVICYGERIPGVSIFTTIPEGTEKIAVDFKTKPNWAQLCNSSWTAFTDNEAATTTENADGTVTMVFPITAANIAAVNETKEVIVNTDANFLSIYIPSATSAITEIEAADENIPVEYFNLQGIRVANPENGLYIRRQGNKVSKVLVK